MSRNRLLRRPLEINDISGEIVDSAMRVHSKFGPGLLESAYAPALAHELTVLRVLCGKAHNTIS